MPPLSRRFLSVDSPTGFTWGSTGGLDSIIRSSSSQRLRLIGEPGFRSKHDSLSRDTGGPWGRQEPAARVCVSLGRRCDGAMIREGTLSPPRRGAGTLPRMTARTFTPMLVRPPARADVDCGCHSYLSSATLPQWTALWAGGQHTGVCGGMRANAGLSPGAGRGRWGPASRKARFLVG